MVSIQDNSVIKMSKGDKVSFEIKVLDGEDKAYELNEGESVKFYLYRNVNRAIFCTPILCKKFSNNIISLDSNDTKNLKSGEYSWNCNLEYEDGNQKTICGGKLYLKEIPGVI